MIGKIVGWLGRKAALYVLLVVMIGIATILAPWAKQVLTESKSAQIRSQALGDTSRTIAAERDAARRAFRNRALSLRGQGIAQLDARLQRLTAERSDLQKRLADAKPAWLLALSNREELLANERRKLRLAVIEQEFAAVRAARVLAVSNGKTLAAAGDLKKKQGRVDKAIRACNEIIERKRQNERDLLWRFGGKWLEQFETAEHKRLVEAVVNCRADAKSVMAQRDILRTAKREKDRLERSARDGLARATSETGYIASVGGELAASAERARVDLAGSVPERVRLWSERLKLPSLLKAAAFALVLIIATPFLIRLFCYFVLAPLAMRRSSIRLDVPNGRGVAIAPSARSATSVALRLAPGEELLVRQDYLQTRSLTTKPTTKWVLNWRRLFTSIATGLTFLVRIRDDGETTTISATRDGLAEVTILTLPEGAACVLQPRALAAVVQPIRQPLRITSHWRFGSLNAWLTLQLRYLVFHGPARLVLKGGRGVRVEAAEQGRVFGQDQLVGFSADLAYSVTRTEPFWPYFLGHQALLDDRIIAGAGVLIIEEAPLTARGGKVRRGLEGMIDAGMKIFGM